jgi:hypothetical protein
MPRALAVLRLITSSNLLAAPASNPINSRRLIVPPYSITLSARTNNAGGIVIPSAFAVFRLIASSNLLACSTGKSFGLGTPQNAIDVARAITKDFPVIETI